MPQQKVRLSENHTLYFRHPGVNRGNPLVIRTGANAIAWDYELNMNVEPTFGGEVQQVLSCAVGPMTVGGSTTDNNQLKTIYEWFRAYGQVAGLNKRDEHGVLFQYPERGWEFYIQPNQMPNFGYAFDQIAREWTITAEIVADPAGSLQRATMNQFTERLFDPSMVAVGFRDRDPRSDPSADPSALPNAKNYADNFQALLGAWASGDFAHWAFDSLARPAEVNHLDPNTKDFWTNFLGSDFVAGAPSTGQGSAIFGGASPVGKVAIIATIAAVFENKGIPGEIAVAACSVETGGSFDPDRRQPGGDFAMGLFQSFPTGRAGSQAHANEVQQAFDHKGDNVTKYWSALHQIQDAAAWWSSYLPVTADQGAWAKRAQGAGDPAYASKVNNLIPEAKNLIRQAQQAGGGLRNQVVSFARAGVAQAPLHYNHGNRPPSQWTRKGIFPQTGMDCSLFATLCYMWAGGPDPNGTHFSGAYSESMLSQGTQVSLGNAQPGDLVVYGGGTGGHVEVIVNVPNGGANQSNVMVASMGSEGGPRLLSIANDGRSDSFQIRSYL